MYFEPTEDTLNPQTGVIKYPSISLNGDNPVIFVAGEGDYTEQGAIATLGVDDISGQMTITGSVDSNVPGLYIIEYSVSTINSIGTESEVTEFRSIAVLHEDVSDVDLSGNYTSTSSFFGPDSQGQKMTISKVDNAYYFATDIFTLPDTDVPGFFFFLGQNEGVLETIPTANSAIGFRIEGQMQITPDSLVVFNLDLPEIGFSVSLSWEIE